MAVKNAEHEIFQEKYGESKRQTCFSKKCPPPHIKSIHLPPSGVIALGPNLPQRIREMPEAGVGLKLLVHRPEIISSRRPLEVYLI